MKPSTEPTVLKQRAVSSQAYHRQEIDRFVNGELQNLERTVAIAVVGFFSLILSIIVLCFCVFAVYNFFYKRIVQKYVMKLDSETQTTDVENNASLQEYGEILIGRHDLTRITRL